MKKILLKFSLLLLPLLGMYIFAYAVLLHGGEFTSIEDVISRQMQGARHVIYGPAYSDRNFFYKHQAVLKRAPKVVVMGRSKMLVIRSCFFKDPAAFYNAGAGILGIDNAKSFLERLPKTSCPQMVIIGLEHFLFNPAYKETQKFSLGNNVNNFAMLMDKGRDVLEDYSNRKFSFNILMERGLPAADFIGINAKMNHHGFRGDGSYLSGKMILDKLAKPPTPDSFDAQFKDAFDRISKGNHFFEYGHHVSPKALAELDALLNFCKQRDIYIVAFLPPYAHVVYARMMALPGKYAYLSELPSSLSNIFRKYDYSFFDFSDLASVGATDMETIDAFHPSEKAYLRLFLIMVEHDARLRAVAADPVLLKKRLTSATSPYTVFANDED